MTSTNEIWSDNPKAVDIWNRGLHIGYYNNSITGVAWSGVLSERTIPAASQIDGRLPSRLSDHEGVHLESCHVNNFNLPHNRSAEPRV